MSIIKFDILADHLKLVPFMKFNIDGRKVVSGDDNQTILGGEDLYTDMGLVLYGKIDPVFDPLSDSIPSYNTEQKKYMEKLFQELPTVIEIVLNTSTFTPGEYKRKYHDISWKKSV